MKISNLGVTSTPLPSQQLGAIASVGGQSAPSGAASETSAYTPSSELIKLVDLARQQPEVRTERVQAATQRLQQGDYQTPAAAHQTAVAMLAALD